jgi:chromosome segregation ATPase
MHGEYLVNPGYVFYGALSERDTAYKLWNESQFNAATLGKHSVRLLGLERENKSLADDLKEARFQIGGLNKKVVTLEAEIKIANDRGDFMFKKVNEQAATLQEVQATQIRMESLLRSLGHQPPY